MFLEQKCFWFTSTKVVICLELFIRLGALLLTLCSLLGAMAGIYYLCSFKISR